MIIKCEQCGGKFRLDDSKVKPEGVKVRCSKCRHIFVVRKEAPVEEAELESLLGGLEAPSKPAAPAEVEAAPPAAVPSAKEPGEETAFSFEETTQPTSPDLSALFAEAEKEVEEAPAEEEKKGYEFGEFSFGEEPFAAAEPAGPSEDAQKPSAPPFEEAAAEEFAFPEEPAETREEFTFEVEETPVKEVPEPPPPAPEEVKVDEFTFEIEPGKEGAEKEEAFTFDVPSPQPAEPEKFEPGEFSFEQEKEQPVKVPKETEEMQFPEPEPKVPEKFTFEEFAAGEEELPPLSIPSRRKGRSLLAIVGAVVAILFLVAVVGVGVAFMLKGPAVLDMMGLGKFAKMAGIVMVEEGSITVKSADGAFLTNSEAGEVFVIRGEVINNYSKPRASIQVKGILYGPTGAVQQKTAYCGNALTNEQLATLPEAKITAVMNNQFGDSLSNMGVKPGATIPYVIVFANVPQGIKDFAVEAAGSTVAAQ